MNAADLDAVPDLGVGRYLALGSLAFRQRLAQPAQLLGIAGFYVLLLCVFAKLYQVLLGGEAAGAAGPRECVWYIAITELILCATPRFHLDIEQDVRLGDVAYQLTRPTSYLGFRLVIAAAELAANLLVLSGIGLVVSYALVGLPADPRVLIAVVPLILLASLLWLLFTAAVGLSAFWVQDTAPVYWIFQKSVFVLGGLWVPLQFYPDWLRSLAMALPFSAMLYTPARALFGTTIPRLAGDVSTLLVWCSLAALLLGYVYHRALRALDVHGG
jgi:ABC-2 type transport system permease protein